jgi:hypothetical protein
MTAVIAVIACIALPSILLWAMMAVAQEAERKLGRELSTGEIILGALAGPAAVLFVILALPEPDKKEGKDD